MSVTNEGGAIAAMREILKNIFCVILFILVIVGIFAISWDSANEKARAREAVVKVKQLEQRLSVLEKNTNK